MNPKEDFKMANLKKGILCLYNSINFSFVQSEFESGVKTQRIANLSVVFGQKL